MTKGARAVGAIGSVALTLAIVACGGGDDGGAVGDTDSSGAPATTASGTPVPADSSDLKITAEEKSGLSFDKKDLTAKAGEVTITMDNPGDNGMPHDVAITGNGVEQAGEVVQPGGTSTVKADLKPGTYTFYCSVGSHRKAGMEGTLEVQ